MTEREHQAQRDMVVRSLLVAPTRSERSEERPRKRFVRQLAPPVFPEPPAHRFVVPVVNETRKL